MDAEHEALKREVAERSAEVRTAIKVLIDHFMAKPDVTEEEKENLRALQLDVESRLAKPRSASRPNDRQ